MSGETSDEQLVTWKDYVRYYPAGWLESRGGADDG